MSVVRRLIDPGTQKLALLRAELRREQRTSEAVIAFMEELHVDEQVELTHKKGYAATGISGVAQATAAADSPEFEVEG